MKVVARWKDGVCVCERGDSKYWWLSKSSALLIYCFPTPPYQPTHFFLYLLLSVFQNQPNNSISHFFSLIYCKNVLSCRQSTWSFLEIFLYGKKFLLTFIDIGGDDDDEDEYDEEID